jgi:sulfate permease, SulP family
LGNSPRKRVFPFLTESEETTLLSTAASRSLCQNEVVIDQNVEMRSIFVLEEGSVRVEYFDRGALIPLTVLHRGEFFGEMSFVDGAATSARVVADEPAQLRVIDLETVGKLSAKLDGFEARLYRSIAAILAKRLRLTSMRSFPDQSWG